MSMQLGGHGHSAISRIPFLSRVRRIVVTSGILTAVALAITASSVFAYNEWLVRNGTTGTATNSAVACYYGYGFAMSYNWRIYAGHPTVGSTTTTAQTVVTQNTLQKLTFNPTTGKNEWKTYGQPAQAVFQATATRYTGADQFTITAAGQYRVVTTIVWPNSVYGVALFEHQQWKYGPYGDVELAGGLNSCTY